MSPPPPRKAEESAPAQRQSELDRHLRDLRDPAALEAAQARVAEAARRETAWKAAARRVAYEASRHSQQGDVQEQQPPRRRGSTVASAPVLAPGALPRPVSAP